MRKAARIEFSTRYDLCNNPDTQVIKVLNNTEPFYIVNVYNERRLIEGSTVQQYTVVWLLQYLQFDLLAIVAGDFNAYYSWWNSTSCYRIQHTRILVDWLRRIQANLLVDSEVTNQYGGTFYRSNLQTESIIDLAFNTGFQQIQWLNWHYAEATGSDYETIAFRAVITGPSKLY
jgi:hypothetical protein